MAASGDDAVSRLLCHLAWLRDEASTEKARTLEWAYRVYNAAVYLQFRFGYPHQLQDRVSASDDTRLSKSLEQVVAKSCEALDVLWWGEELKGGVDSPLPRSVGAQLCSVIDALLADVLHAKWRGSITPKVDPAFDVQINPLRNVREWQSSRRPRSAALAIVDENDPAVCPQAELNKGLGATVVTHHSKVVDRMPAEVRKEARRMSDTMLAIDIEQYGTINNQDTQGVPADVLQGVTQARTGNGVR